MSRSKIEGDIDADANQSVDPSSADLDGFVPFSIPLAAVVARLGGRTIVKVRVTAREDGEGNHPL